MTPLRLATAGIGLVGVSFGMARYGYGLLLPDIRRDFGLGPALLGLIATGSYVGYIAATAISGRLSGRAGPRATAVAGGLLAASGMVLAGLAPTPALFAAGILVAGGSAALCYAPFADAAETIETRIRPRVLSAINCGTGYGVALAAPVAILAGTAWRGAWLAFAAIALAATAWAARVLPRATRRRDDPSPRAPWRLVAGAVVLGAGSSAYWTFAVAHVVDSGALSGTGARTFLAVAGVAGVLATGTGDLVRHLGAQRAFRLLAVTEAAGIALLALVPSAAFVSAILFGAAYNGAVGVQAIASTRHGASPSSGLAAVMGANGVGLMLGPAAAGALASATSFGTVLALGAVLVALSPPAGRRGSARLTRSPARVACASPRPAARR